MANVIKEPAFKGWDLDISFVEDKWSVFLMGYIYSEDFGEINRDIALHGVFLKKIVDAVVRKPINAPTASLNPQHVADLHDITLERAEVIVALAKKVQIKGSAEPLSMFTMFTPEGLVATEDEEYLRGRAIQLSLQYDDETRCDNAIVEIGRVLAAEGLHMVPISAEFEELISDQESVSTDNLILA